MEETSKIAIVGVEVSSCLALGTVDLGQFETRRNGRNDFLCDLVLQFKDICERTVEAVRPKVCAGASVDKLTSDS